MKRYVKIISILLVFVVVLSFAACKKKQYVDTVVSQIVTDENGKAVTDKNGNTVTELVSQQGTDKAQASDKANDKTTNKSNSGNNGADNKVTSKPQKATEKSTSKTGGKTTTEKTTAKPVTTKPTTTKAPKKRNVAVDILLPFYNNQETKMTVYYKVTGDKKYTKLDPIDVKLDSLDKLETVKLDTLKGEVTVIVKFEGIDVLQNKVVIGAYDNKGTIRPVTGIEMIEGEYD